MIRIARTPTWGEVAGLVRYSGFPELAEAIDRVYVTGENDSNLTLLHLQISAEVSLSTLQLNVSYLLPLYSH